MNMKTVVNANTAFGLRLLKQLTITNASGNVFMSPVSISSALTMCLNGAAGDTETRIASTLGLPGDAMADINQGNAALLDALNSSDPHIQLSIANALWADRKFEFAPAFKAIAEQSYAARADTLDFNDPSAAQRINAWVLDHTGGKIGQIVSPADLRGADAVLTDAVYFHGFWTSPFDKASTNDGPFHLADGTDKTLPMMQQTSSFSYADSTDYESIRLPYGSGHLAMYIVLPHDGVSLDSIAGSMSPDEWASMQSSLSRRRLHLVMPRFKASDDLVLNSPLTDLGMGAAFGPGADFKPMGFRRGFIGLVRHKALLEVDETGSTAAAVTAITMRPLAMAMRPPEMIVNHPFLCAIQDDTTGALLFIGLIRNPE